MQEKFNAGLKSDFVANQTPSSDDFTNEKPHKYFGHHQCILPPFLKCKKVSNQMEQYNTKLRKFTSQVVKVDRYLLLVLQYK